MVKKSKEHLFVIAAFVATIVFVLVSYNSFQKNTIKDHRDVINDSLLNIIKKEDSVIKELKSKADKKCPELNKKKKAVKARKVDTIFLNNEN